MVPNSFESILRFEQNRLYSARSNIFHDQAGHSALFLVHAIPQGRRRHGVKSIDFIRVRRIAHTEADPSRKARPFLRMVAFVEIRRRPQ